MSFWRNFGFYAVSPIDTILDRQDFTLETLLNEEEILSEVKSQNKRLLDFLTQPAQLEKLVTYITVPPPEDAENNLKFKYPVLSCEILASEAWSIVDAMFRNELLIERLLTFLDQDPPLHPLLSAFVSRVNAVLLDKKPTQMIELMKRHGNMIDRFLKHISCSHVMDLLLKVVTSEGAVENGGVLQWLRESQLIKSLVEKLNPNEEPELHENAAQALVDIIRYSGPAGSPLMDELESKETVEAILGYSLTATEKGYSDAGARSALLNGLNVVVELIKWHSRSTLNTETKFDELPNILLITLKNIDKLKSVLTSPELSSTKIKTSMGEVEPVGFVRLKVMQLFQALAESHYQCVDQFLIDNDVFSLSFDMFFRFYWNSYLHRIVMGMVTTVFQGNNDELKAAVVTKAQLVQRILDAYAENAEECAKTGIRRGYMGHLTQIASLIQDEGVDCEPLRKALEGIPGWQDFVNSTLRDVRALESRPLGGERSTDAHSDSSDDDNYCEIQNDNDDDDDLILRNDETQLQDEDPEHNFKNSDEEENTNAPTETSDAAENTVGSQETEQPPSDPTDSTD